jgi:hypothetical protein
MSRIAGSRPSAARDLLRIMESCTPNAYLMGGPTPVHSAVKDPRVVSLFGDIDTAQVAAADGSGEHVWRRTEQFRHLEGMALREYRYEGPAESE